MSDTLFDLPVPVRPPHTLPQHVLDGEALRDAALVRVAAAEDEAGDWNARARRWIESLPAGFEFTSETLRACVGDPARPNAVGSVFRTAALRNLIVRTGQHVNATRPSLHASELPKWKRT